MAHFAQISKDNIVKGTYRYYAEGSDNEEPVDLLEAEAGAAAFFSNALAIADGDYFLKCVYFEGGGEPDGTEFRKNFPGAGFTYDPVNDAYIPPEPADGSWILNTTTYRWNKVA